MNTTWGALSVKSDSQGGIAEALPSVSPPPTSLGVGGVGGIASPVKDKDPPPLDFAPPLPAPLLGQTTRRCWSLLQMLHRMMSPFLSLGFVRRPSPFPEV